MEEVRNVIMAPKRQRNTQERKAEKKLVKAVKKVVNEEAKKPRSHKQKVVRAGLASVRVVDNRNKMQKQLRRVEKKLEKTKKEFTGPKPQDSIRLVATLGVITGNKSPDALVRKMKFFLNPLMQKIETSGQTITPLSERAAMYQLFKITKFQVRFVPLVNSSNVSGSIVIADLDQQGNAAKPESVDTIKARLHREVMIGKHTTFDIPKKSLAGPRQGWWGVDPNEDPENTFGPALSVWTYLQTKNLLSTSGQDTTDYLGPLFLAEVSAVYLFANYGPKPALAMLQNEVSTANSGEVSFSTNDQGNLVMTVANSSAANHLSRSFRATTDDHQNQTFWSVCTDAVEAVSPFLGPWSWLLKAGWWIVKKIAGQNSENSVSYYVYSSVEDAQRNQPVQASVSGNTTIPAGTWHVQQLNTPNINNYTQAPSVSNRIYNTLPAGLNPQLTLDVAYESDGSAPRKFPDAANMGMQSLIFLSKTKFSQWTIDRSDYDSGKIQVTAQNYWNIFNNDYKPSGGNWSEIPDKGKRRCVLFYSQGPANVLSAKESTHLGFQCSSRDWNITDLSRSTLLQRVTDLSDDFPYVNVGGRDQNAQIKSKMRQYLSVSSSDTVYVGMVRCVNIVPPEGVGGVKKVFGLFLYNQTKKSLLIAMIGPSPELLNEWKSQTPVFSFWGLAKNGSLSVDANPLGTVIEQDTGETLPSHMYTYDEPDADLDDDDVESTISNLFENVNVQDLKQEMEYWRKTAQGLMMEKTSRNNIFFPSSSGR
uniref:Structural protein n=1 Tax=Red-necked stint avastrovirus TaxID=2592512 RepID=A0A5B8KCV1_9VIRU|nr:structural protein [Red-necked stint avastrovirus]